MEKESGTSKASNDALSNGSLESPSSIVVNEEPFLTFDPKSKLSFVDKSAIYRSLVALVKAEHPFNNVLLDKAFRFLESFEPNWDNPSGAKLVTELVSSSARSRFGFIESIVTLLSSSHSTVVAATFSFLRSSTRAVSLEIRCRLVESDLITKVLAAVQPHTLPISGNETMFSNLITIILDCITITFPSSLISIGFNSAVKKSNHREMIFQKAVIPSSPFVTFLISNLFILNGDVLHSFMSLLGTHIQIGAYHHPTLEFVLASPIVMAFTSCLSFVEQDFRLDTALNYIHRTIYDWKKESPEAAQSGKRMMQALISEGFEDTLEQKMIHEKNGDYGFKIVNSCHTISKLLGSNVGRPRW
ncbi:hypothetical protein BLNAU_7274 [Blattamonas nauphoetae]|uniref:Uncharacterized protein n=1 Tax=Blattamonas nauphoetae TaxID=2049346 RepID=A0ABQ9Y265_9EUKA|nr:hypothetical protein BLNAU_7274 [Blattamonas nauphoetae]